MMAGGGSSPSWRSIPGTSSECQTSVNRPSRARKISWPVMVTGLMWRFLWEYNTTVLRWARWARTEVEAWPEDLSGLDVTAGFSRIVAAASHPDLGIASDPAVP
jgi:hypothetical protein